MSFSMLYFSMAWVAQSTASCCMSSDMSAFLITAFLSVICNNKVSFYFTCKNTKIICQSNITPLVTMVIFLFPRIDIKFRVLDQYKLPMASDFIRIDVSVSIRPADPPRSDFQEINAKEKSPVDDVLLNKHRILRSSLHLQSVCHRNYHLADIRHGLPIGHPSTSPDQE